jgi:hypothetical protein
MIRQLAHSTQLTAEFALLMHYGAHIDGLMTAQICLVAWLLDQALYGLGQLAFVKGWFR